MNPTNCSVNLFKIFADVLTSVKQSNKWKGTLTGLDARILGSILLIDTPTYLFTHPLCTFYKAE